MKQIYRLLSWISYYLGEWAHWELELFSSNETWVNFWYPLYNKFMGWSSDLQDTAGFDPLKVENTAGWPWYKPEDEK